MTHRIRWHDYFMQIARVVASRSTCDRKHVGAVIVRDRTILSTGYNGSIRGMPHCDEIGHMMEGDHCVATIHAETNAVLQAAKNGVRIEGAEVYSTASPCWNCFKMLANAGVRTIYYGEFYRDERIFRHAELAGIRLVDLSGTTPLPDEGEDEDPSANATDGRSMYSGPRDGPRLAKEVRVTDPIRPFRFEEDDEDEQEQKPQGGRDEDAKILEKLLRTRTILISEDVSSELAKRVYQNLLLLESEDSEKPITVIINSPGGEADSGFGIYDMLRFVRPPIRTIVAGLCASAAVLIFIAAEKGSRFSLPHSRFLLHQPSSASFGQASDLEIAANEIIRLRDRYNHLISDATGKPVDQVAHDADRDFWMGAAQAKEYGLVDEVTVRRAETDPKA